MANTNVYSEDLSTEYYKKGIELFETRCNKHIEFKRNYVE